jgi:hypothetical protein
MRNLVSRAPHSIVAHVGDDLYAAHAGLLTGPFANFHPSTALEFGASWAADNGCFLPGYNPDRILSMLRRYQGLPGCLWIVVPDVVQDAAATLQLFTAWIGTYRQYGYPAAFVAQNGIEQHRIPWDSFECLFIGGDDTFKYSDTVRHLVSEAKQRGKWAHNGRVNTPERILYSRSIGCDSFDGTHFTRVPADVARYLPLQIAPISVAVVARRPLQKPVRSPLQPLLL